MEGYSINEKPSHHDDSLYTDHSQDEVYSFSKKLLLEKNLRTVVDLGCGSGYKLMKYFIDYETVGIETEPCLSLLKNIYPYRTWVNSGEPEKSFSVYKSDCDIIICADVIEHIVNPDHLIDYVKAFNFKYFIVSTPDRKVLRSFMGYGEKAWSGPPLNSSHVREWSFDEFKGYLETHFSTVEGFHCDKQTECMFFVCSNPIKKKVRVITADFGNHYRNNYNYELPNQSSLKYDISFTCYNDDNTYSRKLALHPRTKSKIPKMLEWMEYDADYYIWFDSSFTIPSESFVEDVISYLQHYDICVFKHSARSSIREEYNFVSDCMNNNSRYLLDRYEDERMEDQVNFYISDKSFKDDKLFEMGFFAYSKNLVKNKNYNLMTDWFFHNCYWSIQDQLSFPYLLDKHNVNYKTFEGNIYKNNYTKHFNS